MVMSLQTLYSLEILEFMRSLLARPQISQEAFVIQPAGTLNATTVMHFHHQMNAAVASAYHPSLLVDMQHVDQIDSAGLMALIAAFKLAKKFDKQLSFCSLSYTVRMILELTQLDRVLEIV
jgi:anti-anti-sigma factor